MKPKRTASTRRPTRKASPAHKTSRAHPTKRTSPAHAKPSLRTVETLCGEAIQAKRDAMSSATVQRAIFEASLLLAETITGGNTIFACGNGGSACDAMHLCEELVAQYKRERPGIRAMHFMDASTLTCWGNDHGFEGMYTRCAETFCTKGDILVAISTSGKSPNVISAVKAARKKGTKVIVLTGKGGGQLANLGDVVVNIPLFSTERVQEAHIACIHIWCELLETGLVKKLTATR